MSSRRTQMVASSRLQADRTLDDDADADAVGPICHRGGQATKSQHGQGDKGAASCQRVDEARERPADEYERIDIPGSVHG